MTKMNKIVSLFILVFCCVDAVANNYYGRLVSNDICIETGTNEFNAHKQGGGGVLTINNMPGVNLGRTTMSSLNNGSYGASLAKRPVSLAYTTSNEVLNAEEPQGYGGCPDYDTEAPLGDVVFPMVLLLGLLVGIKKL